MATARQTQAELLLELQELTLRLREAEETLEAIRSGGVDALIVETPSGGKELFTLEGADRVYRAFLESISQGALTLDSDEMILYANAAAGRLLASAGGLAGTDLRSFVRRDERRRFDALLAVGRHSPIDAEIRLRGATGGRPVSLPASARGSRRSDDRRPAG